MLLEPERRNTAPAIALSALAIEELTPEATLIVLPSDQGVADSVAFGAALRQAVDAARREEVFVTLGIPPVRPETGYGYLETADGDRASVRRVIRFVEKPAFAKAKEYLASGRFFWNAGIFVFQIRVLLNAMQEFAPEILAAVREAHEARRRGDDAAFRAAFGRSPKLSIDYAVMEKAREVRTVPASCGWSDLGSWESVHDFRPKDQNGNVSEGNATLIGTTNSLVLSCGKKVTVIGLDGVVVVDSPDGLLVSRKGRSDELRDFVEAELARRAKA
jgi:mannose-1-phosphate guanylyltransferase/mannose-6-phosphate isomerase